jgi:glycosyltransferase involved in cell wall biosynthesis
MTRQLNNYHFIPSPDAPAVSVIMPVHNCRAFVLDAVNSILNQTFRDTEFIIVDDASNDGTWEILETCGDERIVVVRQGARTGPYPARNKALRIARGEFIALMDADDVSRPERLARQVKFLRANPETAMVGTCYRIIDEEGAEKSRWEVLLDNDEIKRELPNRNWFCGPSVMFRRGCLRKVGIFDERYRCAADYDMWMRIAEKFNVANIGEFLYDYREHDAQITTARRAEQDEFVGMIQRKTAPPEINDGQPRGSVVIPTKNRPELVTGAIDSALEQTVGDIEVIVVNDGGEDVAAIVPRRGNITYVSSRRCRGLAASRNTGAKLARGEYICFLDDDDILYPEHFETLIEAMNREGLSVAYSNSEKTLIEKTYDGYRITGREPREQHPFDRKQMLVMNYIPVHNLVFRRECLDRAGIFDENLVIHEDWDMWVRLSQNYDFVPVYKNTADVRWWRDRTSLTFKRRAPSIGAMRTIYRKYAALTENDAETRRRQRHCLRTVINEVRALREEMKKERALPIQ